MKITELANKFLSIISMSVGLLSPSIVEAAPIPPTTIPGSADAARVRPTEPEAPIDHSHDNDLAIPETSSLAEIPDIAKTIHLNLKDVHIEGSTVYGHDELAKIYGSYIGKDMTLDVAWLIANRVTELYRNDGYFLSRAYVPAQNVKEGIITIKVVEGYIGDIEVNGGTNYVERKYIERIKAERPAKASDVESFLLRLNDLPGLSFRTVLSPIDDKSNIDEGAIKMALIPADKEGKGSITFDNYSSRFLGPHELSLSYSASLIPLEQTTVSLLGSIPIHELKNGSIDQQITIWPDLILELNAADTQAYPGFNLKQFDIDSNSKSVTASLLYDYIRQRYENLSFKLSLDGRNSTSTVLGTPLTRDHIRALRFGVNADASDNWNGYNIFGFTISKGIDGLGSSQENDINLSRDGAKPNFRKENFTYERLQGISQDWSAVLSASGQLSSGTLFSSEEFGYGGQAFGRAFDSSEITGDEGIEGSIELRYTHYATIEPIGFVPYMFFDDGAVYNDAIDQPKVEDGRSAGFGLHFSAPYQVSGNVGLAFPLTREAANPFYGENGRNPRLLLELSKEF